MQTLVLSRSALHYLAAFVAATMVSVKGFHSGEGTGRVYGWVSIVWLTAAVNIGASQAHKPWIEAQWGRRCGQNLTLLCHVDLPDPGDMKLFTWIFNNMTCKYGESHADSEFVCQSGDLAPQYTLNLTLLNVMPDDQGEYLCKVRSKAGVESFTFNVTVQDCFEPSDFTMNGTHTTCCFSGVYPNGFIHWYQEDVSLTDFAGPQEEKEDQHGRYDICSTLDIHKGNLSQPYKCSLWSPKSGRHLFSHVKTFIPVEKQITEGSTVSLRGDLPIVIIMSVIILTHLTF